MSDDNNQRRHPVRLMSSPFTHQSLLSEQKSNQNTLAWFFLFFLFASWYGCSLPEIIVLNDPLTPEEHLNLGVAYEKRGEFDAARKEYDAASPYLPIAHVYLGNVYFIEGNMVQAENSYHRALEKDPSNADAYNNLAWLYFTLGKNLDGARHLVLRALELNPTKADIYHDTLQKIEGKHR